MKNQYIPSPVNDAATPLSPELETLTEKLAASIHDTWANGRLSQGWTYGPQRDDVAKTHPGLVAYDELSEEEKDYDRNTVRATLRGLLALGYELAPPSETENATQSPTPVEYYARAKKLRRSGEPLQAYDTAHLGLEAWPGDVGLTQLEALCLADLGAPDQANFLLSQLYEQGHRDEETVSILARTFKDMGFAPDVDEDSRNKALEHAFALYHESFCSSGGYYPGINAATLAAVLGRQQSAQEIAHNVHADCMERLSRLKELPESEYYLTATLAEALLLMGRREEALTRYQRTAELAKENYRDIHSTRRNARLLLEAMDARLPELEQVLGLPAVAVLMSSPDAVPENEEQERKLSQALDEMLERRKIAFGYSTGAPGADLLFLEALLRRGSEAHMLLPFNKEEYLGWIGEVDSSLNWSGRFEAVYKQLEALERVATASVWRISDGALSHAYANQILLGMARLKAQQLDTELVPVLAGNELLRSRMVAGCPNFDDHESLPVPLRDEAMEVEGQESSRPDVRIRAMLFADVVGYSKLREEHVPPFVDAFMGSVAHLLESATRPPEVKNTWGDALYMVFEDTMSAADFALRLVDMVNNENWELRGLPKGLNMRVSLHAGPVYKCVDRVLQAETYTGTHVSKAARLEPITPPGQVFTSRDFAALAAVEDNPELRFDYVGRVGFAKGFGSYPVYHLRRA